MGQAFSHALHVAVHDLRVERSGRCVLSAVSFELGGGQALWLRGPNGAGKSTILRVLAGFLPYQGGRIDLTVDEPHDCARDAIHFLGYQDALKSTLSLRENLSFWATLLSRSDEEGTCEERVSMALRTVGLHHLAMLPAGYLSAGQKKRMALARLLVTQRPIWLMDEPSLTLDQEAHDLLVGMMSAHRARGGMIIFASHTPLGLADVHHYDLRSGVKNHDD
jgi:heme exporter protein A